MLPDLVKIYAKMLAGAWMKFWAQLSGRYRTERTAARPGATKMEQFDRIPTDVTRMNGEPCIRNLRLTVRRVLEALATYPDEARVPGA
jgi:hypothetical protein